MRSTPRNAHASATSSDVRLVRSNGRATGPRNKTTERTWERYRDNTARHLIGIARDQDHRAQQYLTEDRGYEGLRPSLGPLISLVATEPRPLGVLAAELSISAQACSQLVDVGDRAGFTSRRADSSDRCSRVVSLTPRGRKLVRDAAHILTVIEADYRARVGDTFFDSICTALQQLAELIPLPVRSAKVPSSKLASSLGLLPLLSVHVQRELMLATERRGHLGLKMSHAQVLPLIGPDGAQVTTLARIQGVSRQAISSTARDLETLGFLARASDARDGRAVVFKLTSKGESLIADSVRSLDELDDQLERTLGARRWRGLQTGARTLYASLDLEREVFARTARANQARGADQLTRLAQELRRELGAVDADRLANILANSASQ